ncbi:MAG: hypothetical protein U0414_08465 [Polyangiaceae bacterium]
MKKVIGSLMASAAILTACSGGIPFLNGLGSTTGSDAPPAAPEPEKPVPMRSIAGSYSFQDGLVTITQTGDTAHGDYPAGTFDCKYEISRYKCTWQEGDQKGFAEIHWYDDELLGNWGLTPEYNGGPWDFRDPDYDWSARTTASSGSSGSDSSSASTPTSVSVSLVNDCSSSVYYCEVSRGGGSRKVNLSLSGHTSTSHTLDVGGTITAAKGSSCGEVIATIDASTRTVKVCK